MMTTYDYQSVIQRLRGLQPWQIDALCATSAEKIVPILRFLALPDTYALANSCIDCVWKCAATQASVVEELERLVEQLEATPEWQCESPDTLSFVVARALNLVHFALVAAKSSSTSEKVNNAGLSLLLETSELFDLAMEQHAHLDGHEPIEIVEEASQLLLVDMLEKQGQPTEDLIDLLKSEAKTIGQRFEQALPMYCYHYVKSLIQSNAGQ